MKKILICGHRSFVASGLEQKLEKEGFNVECFSRGELLKEGNCITGNVYDMINNPLLADEYDTVINFIIIQNNGVDENIKYIQSLHNFCEHRKVKRLIQISSISVYPNNVHYVDEDSKIETNPDAKGGYACYKVAVDNYLESIEHSYDIIYVRPGYIISDEKPVSLVGILKSFGPLFGLLLGNQKTSLPLVQKSKVHEALIRIVKNNSPQKVYLLLENRNGKKIDLVHQCYKGCVICLPKKLTVLTARFLYAIKIFKYRHYQQVLGLFKDTYFDSSETEYNLQLSFDDQSVVVIGSGAYGSYIINKLAETGQSKHITLLEIGERPVKDEDEMGIGTNITGGNYTGLKSGRFFCFGGATRKWGGQLLTFTKNDIKHPSHWMSDIVETDEKYSTRVFSKFGFKNSFDEHWVSDGLFTKTGTWLGYFNRDLCKYFKATEKAFVKSGLRVSKLDIDKDTKEVKGIEMVSREGKIKHAYYNYYFLSAGAFESNRIILSSGLVDSIHFSDHLSQKVFKMKGMPVIGGEDFQFRVKGSSLITKRLIGEVDDVSFFANPIYNADFPLFQNMKELMFKGNRSMKIVLAIIRDIPSAIGFAWSMVVKKRIYVYKKQWDLNIDIENLSEESSITLSEDKDEWGINKLNVNFVVGEVSTKVFNGAADIVKEYLDKNHILYESVSDKIHVEKSEDTYHPYGMFLSNCESKEDYYNYFPNMLVVNTGILPRAGGINTTATCFPLIEDFIDNHFNKSK